MSQGYPPGDPRARAAGRRGGSTSGERRGAAARWRWLARFPGVEPEVAKRIWTIGYNSGHAAGKRLTQTRQPPGQNGPVA